LSWYESTSRRSGHAVHAIHYRCGCGGRRVEELCWQRLACRLNIVLARLRGKQSFGLVAMTLALAVLLVGVLDRDLLIHEILSVEIGNGFIRSLEVGEGHETITLGQVGIISGDLKST